MDRSDIAFEKYYEDVLRFLRGLSRDEYLAEELTQETIYRALKSIDTYRGEADLRVWLCSIAKNLYYTHCKKRKRIVSEGAREEGTAEEKLIARVVEDKETVFQIHRLLHELREPYKEVFSLRVFGELSFKEIGELFQKSEHWACVTYHRARGMIGERLQEGEKTGTGRTVSERQSQPAGTGKTTAALKKRCESEQRSEFTERSTHEN